MLALCIKRMVLGWLVQVIEHPPHKLYMRTRFYHAALFAASLAAARLNGAQVAPATATTPNVPSRLTAIFVENRAGPQFADKIEAFRSLLASHLSGSGFSVVSPEISVHALQTLAAGGPPTPADSLLTNQSSALHLAQNLGAQYVLVATLSTYGTDKRSFGGYGVNVLTDLATLRATYNLCDATQGGSISSGEVVINHSVAETPNLKTDDKDMINGMFDQAAGELADVFLRSTGVQNIPTSAGLPAQVDFSISTTMADTALPDILRTADGQYVVGPMNYTVTPLDATVTLNGAAIGSAPGAFKGPPGLSTMRISREGFKPWEQIVNLNPGFKLNVALQMDDAGYARWQNSITFLQNLKSGTKLTDAEVQKILGYATSLRNSGMRLDERSNITIDANQLPPVQQVYQSLLAPTPLPPLAAPPQAAPAR